MDERPARSPATWLLLLLCTVATALPLAFAAGSLLIALGVRDVDARDAALSGAGLVGVYGEQAMRNAEGFTAAVVGATAAVCLILLVGLVTWRTWAREATLAVFGLVGAFLCLVATAGVAGEARNGGLGLLAGVLLLLTAGLAVSPPVAADFDRRRIAGEVRERRRREQERRDRAAG